jgi:hypothetical protein
MFLSCVSRKGLKVFLHNNVSKHNDSFIEKNGQNLPKILFDIVCTVQHAR